MGLVAGIDTSTQSTKVELRDVETGAVVATASSPHPPTTPPISEQDPQTWWHAFERCWEQLGDPQVDAISVAGQQHGLVALDSDRAVIRPAKLWNDTESAPDARWLLAQVDGGAAAWAEAVGSVPVAAFTITKLSWLHRSEPEAWARLAHVLLPHDWMTARLTGRLDGAEAGALVTDRGDASGTGYWSPSAESYRFDLLAVVDRDRDWAEALPMVLGPRDVAGEWRGATVAAGTGDNMGAALGMGLRTGDAVISLGTSGTVFTRSDRPVSDASGTVAGFADAAGGHLPLVCTLNAGKVLDAVRRLLGVDHSEFDALVRDGRSDGLTLLPYFDGERTPDLPGATGWLTGLRSDVERDQLARAAVEGVICGLLDGLDALGSQVELPDTGTVIVTGGVAASPAVRSVLAALCDREVVWIDVPDAVATGACVQAASVLTRSSPDEVATRWHLGVGEPVGPAALGRSAGAERSDDARHELRGRYRDLRAAAYPDPS